MRSPCSQRKSLFRLIINNYFTTLIISSLSLALSLRPVSISPLLRRADALLVGELGGGLLRGGRGGGGGVALFHSRGSEILWILR